MTLDEMEHQYEPPKREALPIYLSDEWQAVDDTPEFDAGFGTAQYDIAYGMEVTALLQGLCPQCGDGVERNTMLNLHSQEETLYYDCIFDHRHRYLILKADQNDFR